MSKKNWERAAHRGGTFSEDGGKILNHRALKYKWFLHVDYLKWMLSVWHQQVDCKESCVVFHVCL